MNDQHVVIWGLGKFGKNLIDSYLDYGISQIIIAIIDNGYQNSEYRGIKVFTQEHLADIVFDEIWIATSKFYSEVYDYLLANDVCSGKIKRAEYLPVFEKRIRKKYSKYIDGTFIYEDKELQEVFDYLKFNSLSMYNYSFFNEYMQNKIEIKLDETVQLYYTEYNSKRMYLPRNMNFMSAQMYCRDTIMEQDRRSPHCYLQFKNLLYEKKIVVDIGAAEGIFGLEIIDTIDFLFLIETDSNWIEALKHTFEPYKDKVKIINKFISDCDKEDCSKLDTLFASKKIDLIKMDIEGAEQKALAGAKEMLKSGNTSFEICSYHKKNDLNDISKLLKDNGYKVQVSHGYVLCKAGWELDSKDVDFRRAIVYGTPSL